MAEIHSSTHRKHKSDRLSYCDFINKRERIKGINSGKVKSFHKKEKLEIQSNEDNTEGAQSKEFILVRIKSNLTRKALEQPETNTVDLVAEEYESLSADERVAFPDVDMLYQLVNTTRSQLSLQRCVNTTAADIKISESHLKTIAGKQFLLHDNIIRNEVDDTTHRTIIFATEKNLRNLFASAIWYVNGNFRIKPTMFLQLWTIHAKVPESIVPLAYILMQSKKKEEYLEILLRLRQKAVELQIFDQAPSMIIVDSSISAINALRSVFPHAQLRMSMYDLKQSFCKTIQDFSLHAKYKKDDCLIKQWLCSAIGLAYVPPAEVPEAFELLLKELDSDRSEVSVRLKAVAQHLDKNYIRGRHNLQTRYPIEIWNIYERTLADDVRNDSVFEEWDTKFSRSVYSCKESIHTMISAIRREQDFFEGILTDIIAGKRNALQPIAKQTICRDEQIRSYVMRYEEFKTMGRILEYIKTVGSFSVDS